MITEDYVSFETAKLLKEKGFDEECQQYYGDYKYPCPTLQMAMKWLREVHNIDVVIDVVVGMLGVKVYFPLISTYKPLKDSTSKVRQIKRGIYYKDDNGVIPASQHFDFYEEACEEAIKYCLENLV